MNANARKRSRLACNPCRERKRKCDGSSPCTTCTAYGYDCTYASATRQRRQRSRTAGVVDVTGATGHADDLPDLAPPPDGRSAAVAKSKVQGSRGPGVSGVPDADRSGLAQRLEGNSGAAFVRRLGLKIDPARAPKLNLFGWNVGARQLATPLDTAGRVLSIVEITSLEHLQVLARVYFDKVDLCYGFLEGRVFSQRLDRRFQQLQHPSTSRQAGDSNNNGSSHDVGDDVFDSIIAGVAALGCLFSQGSATLTELQFVRTARHILDTHQLPGPPDIDLVTAWALRTVYLRLTDAPHAVWMASCTLMHFVEASGLHEQTAAADGNQDGKDGKDGVNLGIAGRLLGIAHHLHVWTSFDLGLTRVAFLKTDLSLPLLSGPPTGDDNDATAQLLGLLPMSVNLDPSRPRDAADLTATLVRLLDGRHTMAPSVLAQCNLVLCLLRRFHTQHLDVAPDLEAQVLTLLRRGLACARDMVLHCSPWHQASNVPFQTICVLLVLDTRASLALLPEAMQTLALAASVYDTERMREAHSAARLLVRLHQQRRRDDIALLSQALHQAPPPQYPQQQLEVPQMPQDQQPPLEQDQEQSLLGPSAEEFSWLGALVADLPGLQRVDLEQFLSTDMVDDFDGGMVM